MTRPTPKSYRYHHHRH